MSRTGKKPIPVPAGVTASVEGGTISVKGPKGTLTMPTADDISYENMPMAPIVGPDAVRATLEGFLAAATAVDWPVKRQVVSGSVVINERNDRFQIGTGWLELPVAGFFEVNDDGRISLWRDYFDLGSYVSQLTELMK